ncbi:MAG: response regulator [Paracoccaceae bacterium]
MRFLAVDDDPAVLEIICDLMERDGRHEVATANSPMLGLQMAQARPEAFDAFLLDIQMPGMSGVELCGELRAIEPLRKAPIIMVTRVSERGFIDDAFAAGATDYMNKPIDPLEWKSRIKMVERLHDERQRAEMLTLRALAANPEYQQPVDFESAIPLHGQENAIEYLALENYLLTLDGRGLFAHAAMGIHVENALQIHRRANPVVFVETMGDVAAAIFEAVKAHSCMFAYAGAGDFVVVTSRQALIDRENLEFQINHALTEFESIYVADGLPTPRVRVGEQARGSLFGARRATAILQQALEKAQGSSTRDTGVETRLLQLRKVLA